MLQCHQLRAQQPPQVLALRVSRERVQGTADALPGLMVVSLAPRQQCSVVVGLKDVGTLGTAGP